MLATLRPNTGPPGGSVVRQPRCPDTVESLKPPEQAPNDAIEVSAIAKEEARC
jgi:hypothetical protein